ncbi:hypothetical protein BTJ68_15529 [Hortaea werneckii EXF-2000]|uniref:Uncharacterized protein n=1 Tax=Hortaea werneckii EXF-2000 TaxID=1157616 RepID=A0A1Z5SLP5_HORWE|nr:hypothetical protein BTJ68_15529 [Hortaea werneckii EXF-2000]
MRTQTIRFPFLSGPAREGSRPAPGREREGAGGKKGGSEGGRTEGEGRVGRDVPLREIRRVVFPSRSSSTTTSSSSSSFSASSSPTFSDLWTLHRRLRSWEECEEVWRRCVSWGPEFAWARDRWEGVHFWGLVELVRLGDAVGSGCSGVKGEPLFQDGRDEHAHEHEHERHTTRLTHLHSLPPPALALLLFKLHTALRILRVLGPYPLRTTSTPSQHGRPWDSTTPQEIEMEEVWHDGNGAGLTRCEVEVAVEECLLGYGPEVLVGLVEGGDRDGDRDGGEKRGEEQQKQEQEQQRRRRQRRGRWARSLFETELQSLNSRQQPFPDGTPKPPTLIACLRRTFADQTGVAFAETEGKMWEVLSSSEMGLDGDGHERMGSIIGREF